LRIFSAIVSSLLVPLLTAAPVLAQSATLQLRAINQDAASNRLAVEVVDAGGQPVPEASVVFHVPEGASFSDGKPAATVVTGTDGRAQIGGIHWAASGSAVVRITAAKGTAHTGLLLETNVPAAARVASGAEPATEAPTPVTPGAQAAPPPSSPATAPVAQEPPVRRQPSHIIRANPVIEGEDAGTPQTEAEKPRQPGIVVQNDDSPNTNVPIRYLSAGGAGGPFSPRMSIVSSGKSSSDHHVRNRILIGLAVAAGAGAAIAFTRGMSSSSSSSSSGVTVGPPSVGVGKP
jgi:hypothetical protein